MVLVLVLSVAVFAACNPDSPEMPVRHPEIDQETYLTKSQEIYDAQLGEFKTAYAKALAAENVSERFALMAIAEAKLLESGVFLPATAQGGNYAISKAAPGTITSVLWGNDSDRFHNVIVATELIKATDRSAMKAEWSKMKSAGKLGAEYESYVKSYLTEKGYSIKRTYDIGYVSDPQTWDALATSNSEDSEAIVNTYDSLLEYDALNNLQPALAQSYDVSEDGLTYTFHLREGLTWVNSQGKKVADLKADDFVAGFQHMLDAEGGLEYLVQGVIKNAAEYCEGKATFAEVGVKATDERTVVYTLEQPANYFLTMLGYNIFAPMSRSYYESKGGKFGADFNAAAEDYKYGKTKDDIAYCGPYTVESYAKESEVVFTKNESYWNKDGINVDKITWHYNDNSVATKAYDDVMSGVLDGTGLNSAALQKAKQSTVFDTYHYVSTPNATSFVNFVNLNRTYYANMNDETALVSPKTLEQAQKTTKAVQNVHFRRALAMGLDRVTYNAQTVGAELAPVSLINSYTPGNFVSLTEDVTVDINGKATEFKKGTFYGQILQAQIDADGVKIKVWDPKADDGAGGSTGYDGWYNAENAKAELEIAISELAKEGVEVSASNPVHIDLPYNSASSVYTNRATAYKQSIEKSLEGKVIVNLVAAAKQDQWLYAGYRITAGYQANYDIYDLAGWGPDYGDPSSYLDTIAEGGYMLKCLGIF
ncbi:MAG TPA: peptide ABC transporter substrate-binding protein [Clostridiales bacterium]|nr:peptide ABC transporter substrate-binding protein [Clostridiales bacterium]